MTEWWLSLSPHWREFVRIFVPVLIVWSFMMWNGYYHVKRAYRYGYEDGLNMRRSNR